MPKFDSKQSDLNGLNLYRPLKLSPEILNSIESQIITIFVYHVD